MDSRLYHIKGKSVADMPRHCYMGPGRSQVIPVEYIKWSLTGVKLNERQSLWARQSLEW